MSLLFLAGCPNAGTQTPLPGTTAQPTQGPTGAQSAPGSTATGTSGASNPGSGSTSTGSSTVTPTPVPSAPGLGTTTVRGTVYDENAGTVDGASVRVVSLNASVPFDSTVTANGGAYVVNGVPAGVSVAIMATKPNWTSRTRVATLLPLTSAQPNEIDFGGTSTTPDASGPAYFICDCPEISALSPASGDSIAAGSTLTYKITFSEPLDAANQRRVDDAVHFTPDSPPTAAASMDINDGSYFGVDSNTVKTTWDTAGSTLTVTFQAPLYTQNNNDQTYQFYLKRPDGASPIVDPAGHVLGYTAPDAGVRYNAIAISSPSLNNQTTGAARWQATHVGSASFKVTKDTTQPKLVSTSVSSITLNGVASKRFALTFNEPMAVYGNNTAAVTGANTVTQGSTVNSSTAINNYQFIISKSSLTGTDIDTTPSETGTTGVGSSTDSTGSKALASQLVFTFDGSQSGVNVQPSTSDPNTLLVTVPASMVPSDALYYKVEAKNIQDPAGNSISTANGNGGSAGDNIATGQF